MLGIHESSALQFGVVVRKAIYPLPFAAMLGLQGCGQAPGDSGPVINSKEPVSGIAAAADGEVNVAHVAVKVSDINLYSVSNGEVSPLEGANLQPSDNLRITIELAGTTKQAVLEIRIADTVSSGIFRDVKSLEVQGKAYATFDIAAPAGGWKTGRYVVYPFIDYAPAAATSFLVA